MHLSVYGRAQIVILSWFRRHERHNFTYSHTHGTLSRLATAVAHYKLHADGLSTLFTHTEMKQRSRSAASTGFAVRVSMAVAWPQNKAHILATSSRQSLAEESAR